MYLRRQQFRVTSEHHCSCTACSRSKSASLFLESVFTLQECITVPVQRVHAPRVQHCSVERVQAPRQHHCYCTACSRSKSALLFLYSVFTLQECITIPVQRDHAPRVHHCSCECEHHCSGFNFLSRCSGCSVAGRLLLCCSQDAIKRLEAHFGPRLPTARQSS